MDSFTLPFLLTLFSLLYFSSAIPPYRPPLTITHLSEDEWVRLGSSHVILDSAWGGSSPPPRTFFEVTRPVLHPSTTPCSHLVLQHDFAFTYGHPPTSVLYTPPSHCPSTHFSTIILEFSATCKGRQFDRILGVWLGGVELLRSSTAEPTRDGIFWKVEKDISRYISLVMTPNQTLAVYLGNIVDSTYTGVHHVNVTLHYYPADKLSKNHATEVGNKPDLYQHWPDLILPVSRNEPLNDGLWFEIQNFTQVESKEVMFPQNVYKAVLEVYVSYHENDEFWDTNLPNDYLLSNNLTTGNGNGNFREVLVSLDGDLIGAICPFTVIFTGGINPLLWRPISGIGSFNLPSYDVEITPFLGKLLDGKPHSFGFSVSNSANVWLVDANLHLWLDKKKGVTKGQLSEHNAKPVRLSYRSNFKGLDGKFFTGASRLISSTGWVESSYGNITTTSIQKFDFKNFMELRNNCSLQIVNRTIDFNTSVSAKLMSSSSFYTIESRKRFPLYYYGSQIDQGNEGYTLYSNVTVGFNEDKKSAGEIGFFSCSLRNEQIGDGIMVVKNDSVDSAIASMHQVYEYDESTHKFCYFRNVSSYNYTILYDEVRQKCTSTHLNHASHSA